MAPRLVRHLQVFEFASIHFLAFLRHSWTSCSNLLVRPSSSRWRIISITTVGTAEAHVVRSTCISPYHSIPPYLLSLQLWRRRVCCRRIISCIVLPTKYGACGTFRTPTCTCTLQPLSLVPFSHSQFFFFAFIVGGQHSRPH